MYRNLCGCGCGEYAKKTNKYIHGHFWRGYKHSDNTKEKMSISAEQRLPTPKEDWWKFGSKGEKHPLYGKEHSDETKKKISETTKRQYKNGRVNNFTGKRHTDESKRKMSERKKELWKDPEFRDKMVKGIMTLGQNSPNRSEQKLWNLLEKHYPGQWDFVGDGKLIVNGKCPDFVNRRQNLIIEMFGDYWHQNENPIDRIGMFEPNYKTLVIWESEMKKSMIKVQERINEFMGVE